MSFGPQRLDAAICDALKADASSRPPPVCGGGRHVMPVEDTLVRTHVSCWALPGLLVLSSAAAWSSPEKASQPARPAPAAGAATTSTPNAAAPAASAAVSTP